MYLVSVYLYKLTHFIKLSSFCDIESFPLCCLPINSNLFAILEKKYLDIPIYLVGLYAILNNFSQMKNVIPCNIYLGFPRVLGCTNSMKKHTWKQIQLVGLTVQVSCSLVSDSLWPHGLQHARLPCLSPTPRACSNSCPSSWWCHTTISSSVVPFSSCLQSFPVSGSLPKSQLISLYDRKI